MRWIVVGLILFTLSSAQGRWLVGEGDRKPRQTLDNGKIEQKVSQFWKTHKAGVSLSVNGDLGTFGMAFGMHFHPLWSGQIGFGGSSHYQAFGIRVKRLFMASSPLTPYLAGGLSRWERNRGGAFDEKEVSPTFLVRRLMSADDRRRYDIDEKLLSMVAGLQYVFVEGEWKGFGVFLEGLVFVDLQEWVSAPTVSLGASYYF